HWTAKPYTVVGIMPKGFSFPPPMTFMSNELPKDCEVWLPLVLDRANRDYHPLAGVAGLKRGVKIEQARAGVAGLAARWHRNMRNRTGDRWNDLSDERAGGGERASRAGLAAG